MMILGTFLYFSICLSTSNQMLLIIHILEQLKQKLSLQDAEPWGGWRKVTSEGIQILMDTGKYLVTNCLSSSCSNKVLQTGCLMQKFISYCSAGRR